MSDIGFLNHPRVKAFRDAGQGVLAGLRTQPHLRFHIFAALGVLTLLILADQQGQALNPYLPVLIYLLFGIIMGLELVNSAVESACDAITLEHNPLIGRSKDMAAGAVLMMAGAAGLSGLYLLLPVGIRLITCGKSILDMEAFPACAAMWLGYGMHHVLGRGKPGIPLIIVTGISGTIFSIFTFWWYGLPLVILLFLGLYGGRKRESGVAH